MSALETLDRLVMHPLTLVSVLLGALGSVVHIPVLSAIVSVAWHQAGTLFAAVSVVVSQGLVPAWVGEVLMLLAGSLFLGRLLDKLHNGVQKRLQQ